MSPATLPDPIVLAPEVRDALASGRPVVALESSVIAHGLPHPQNLETASAAEGAVRESGAVPAMVAVVDGSVRVGLDPETAERIATAVRVPKVGNRDLGPVLSGGGLGATTFAATLAVADLTGVEVVACGGLGGVHRGAAESFDVSADLIELTRSSAVVVSGGVKSILDVGATLEYLETQGVPVIGHGCDQFPAFYCPTSGFPVPHRMDKDEQVAAAAEFHWQLGGTGSLLVAAPIPHDAALDVTEHDRVIQEALDAAERDGVRGPSLTPYLMKHIGAATGERSAVANRAVLLNSAALAGRIAVALADRRAVRRTEEPPPCIASSPKDDEREPNDER
ncbi:pseudouridine-5'-phosphate glycosidase [Streptomyces sp. NPDC021093]|uniref:pseudouridine-5'-phosphate glycosidase n=1 Tax=Streptomyces sp. NPDC021093 TaxID=3365112 RepID=UPI00378C4562